MNFLRHLSIQNKLMLSMAACLLLFLAISTALSVTMTGSGIRERVVSQELPSVVGEIRNDIRRQIAVPLATSLAIANNAYLHSWEAEGLPESGLLTPGKRTRSRSRTRTRLPPCSGCRKRPATT
ncbi:hypothetical protein LP420_24875 [Massilia sp. B-10]|nr:hypothetical protein LP420_24875 [Massilia sp. B-10]